MLEKPDLQDEEIAACLLESYGLSAVGIEFLPLGADQNSAVYRVIAADDELHYLLKLRRRNFDELSVALPKFLADQGVKQILPPVESAAGQLWATLGDFTVILYPFIAGRDGYKVKMSEGQWREFGAALRQIHTVDLSADLVDLIKIEHFTPQWREAVKLYLERARSDVFVDPIAKDLADYLTNRSEQTLSLVERAEQLARDFQARSPKFVLCHADIHAGNILIGDDGDFYIIDWDDAILAPKERDLMFVGGALMGDWRSAREEEVLFYAAYGGMVANPVGIAYYRYERIIADIAVISQQIFSAAGSVADREQFFGYLRSNFQPGDTIEMAYRADPSGWPAQQNLGG